MKLYGYDLPDDVCDRIGASLGHLGSKWAIPLIARLEPGPMRSNALHRSLPGVSRKVLTETLRKLEANGYVLRSIVPSVPPQVEYRLSDPCRALLAPMRDLLRAAAAQLPGAEPASSSGEDARL